MTTTSAKELARRIFMRGLLSSPAPAVVFIPSNANPDARERMERNRDDRLVAAQRALAESEAELEDFVRLYDH